MVAPEPASEASTLANTNEYPHEKDSIDSAGPRYSIGATGSKASTEEFDERVPHTDRADGKIELTEEDAYDKLGFCYPSWKKWTIPR